MKGIYKYILEWNLFHLISSFSQPGLPESSFNAATCYVCIVSSVLIMNCLGAAENQERWAINLTN